MNDFLLFFGGMICGGLLIASFWLTRRSCLQDEIYHLKQENYHLGESNGRLKRMQDSMAVGNRQLRTKLARAREAIGFPAEDADDEEGDEPPGWIQ